MAPKLITVVGATGQQGKPVALYFAKQGWRVRGTTRDPSRPACDVLRAAGVDMVAADLNDSASLDAAFAGAHAIYGVTDFWAVFGDPATQAAAAAQGVEANVLAMRGETQQARNVADAAARALARDGLLERLVLSTLADSKKWSNGAITENYHFDGKAAGAAYVREKLPALAAVTSYLQMGFYMTNWRMASVWRPNKQPDGTFTFRLVDAGVAQPKLMPFVDPARDNGVYVWALVTRAPPQTTLLATSDELPREAAAEAFARANNVTCKVVPMSHEEWLALVPGSLGRELLASMQFCAVYGFDGGDPDVKRPADVGIAAGELTSLDAYSRMEDWSEVLAGTYDGSGGVM